MFAHPPHLTSVEEGRLPAQAKHALSTRDHSASTVTSVRIGLVGCVKAKRSSPAPAGDLYVSPLFLGRRRYVERTCEQWFVLSAKHGLLPPTELVAPYDETLKTKPTAARRRWSDQVLDQLLGVLPEPQGITFEIHAGAEYRDFGLIEGLHHLGSEIVIPARGLGIGRQLAFYSQPSPLD
jgi:hypothetical protein